METARFDLFVRRLAGFQWSRRAALRVGIAGGAALFPGAGLPWTRTGSMGSAAAEEATPTAAATPPGAVNLNGTWLCDQSYALCSTSPCEPTPWDATIATCPCTVESRYSIGFKTCNERAPAEQTLFSNFSTANAASGVRHLSCPERGVWANCLDMPCIISQDDPTKAICLCPLEESDDYVTFGGECDSTTCSTVIWSAASTSGNVIPDYQAAMAQVGQDAVIPGACPAAATSASPTSG